MRAEDDGIIISLDERLRCNFVERTTALLQLQYIVTTIDASTNNSTAKNSTIHFNSTSNNNDIATDKTKQSVTAMVYLL